MRDNIVSQDKKQNVREPKNNKKAAWIFILLCMACIMAVMALYYIYTGSARETMKWAKNLSPDEVSGIEMVIFPQDNDRQYKVFSDEEEKSAVALIGESRGRYIADPEEICGGGISLYLHMEDGSEHVVSNIGNLYLCIDGDHYDAGYGWLSSWPYTEGDSPLPWNFYGTSVPTPESYVSFQAEVLEIDDSNMLVKPMPGSLELDSADRFTIPIAKMPPSLETEAGDVIEIQYNGEILESYPAQLGEVYGVAVIVKN